MPFLKKRILVLFASGSVLSSRRNTSIFFVDSTQDIDKWLAEIPEVSLLADIHPLYVVGESDQFTDRTVEQITSFLNENHDNYDGFVVLVRADRLVRTAVIAEFLLQGFGKPIIFTGSRRVPEKISVRAIAQIIKAGGLGLRSNLINAVQIALSKDFPVIGIMFGNKLTKPTRAEVSDFQAINLFKSVDNTYLGKVDFGISLNRKTHVSADRKTYAHLSRVVAVTNFESLPLLLASDMKQDRFKVLLVRLRENEMLSVDAVIELRKRFEIIMEFNERRINDQRGVIGICGMTWDAAQIKVFWAHAVAKSAEEFSDLMARNIVGEQITL